MGRFVDESPEDRLRDKLVRLVRDALHDVNRKSPDASNVSFEAFVDALDPADPVVRRFFEQIVSTTVRRSALAASAAGPRRAVLASRRPLPGLRAREGAAAEDETGSSDNDVPAPALGVPDWTVASALVCADAGGGGSCLSQEMRFLGGLGTANAQERRSSGRIAFEPPWRRVTAESDASGTRRYRLYVERMLNGTGGGSSSASGDGLGGEGTAAHAAQTQRPETLGMASAMVAPDVAPLDVTSTGDGVGDPYDSLLDLLMSTRESAM